MKSKMIIVVFLLFLYIVPSLFAMTSSSLPTLAEPNISKDFALSEYEYGRHLATDDDGTPAPTGDFTDTHIKDGSSMYIEDASCPYDCEIILDFDLPEEDFDAVFLNFYGYAFAFDLSLTTKELLMWNSTTWNDFGDIGDSAEWTNITLDSSYILSNTVYMKVHANDDSITTLLIDYAEVVLCNFSYTSGDWFNKNWGWRKVISVEGATGAGTNYQIQVNVDFETGMQSDFDDICFYDNNGVTPLNYWLESYTASTEAVFWVEVKDNLDTDQMIYMYFGNADVSTTSDGEATFLLFDDFEDDNLDNWNYTNNMETTAVRTHDGSSYSASWTADADAHLKDNGYGLTGIRISFWVNQEDTLRGSFNYVYSVDDYSERVATIRGGYETGTSPLYYRDSGSYVIYPSSVDDINDDEWNKIEFSVDFTADKMQTWQNDVANSELAVVEDDGTALETEIADGVGLQMQSSKQCWFDDVIVRKWIVVEPISIISERTETAPPPEWNIVNEVELIFNVPYNETGFNMFITFGGLFVIIAAPMYLVKGGKDEISLDKVFFFIIAFMLGWALLLGGISA